MSQPVDPGAMRPGGPAAGAAACYRHPDRLTRIHCTRCDRPICPECMIPASVGFQCPEDVREGNKGMRAATPRTLTGSVMSTRPGFVTIALIVLNVLVYAAQKASAPLTERFDLYGRSVEHGEYYRLFTAAFLHDPRSFTHIAFNMFSLYVLGTQVERLLGTTRFLGVYLLAALGGTTASFAFQPSGASSLGASGAIFGLLGALLVIVRRLKLDPGPVLSMLAINVVFSFTVPGIDWRAHFGGLVVGLAVARAFTYTAPGTRAWLHPVSALVILACITALAITRAHTGHALGQSGAMSAAVAEPLLPQGVHHVS